MSGLLLVIKFTTLFLVIATCVGNTNGLKCFKCQDVPEDFQKLMGQDFDAGTTCKNNMTQICPASSSYCLKVEVTVLGGHKAALRTCAEDAWNYILGGEDCLPVTEIPNFKFRAGGQELKPEGGKLCICKTDGCNG